MNINQSKTQSQNKVDNKKYQYYTGALPTNTNLSASSIDQHRNSIQQRIANLQAKISKKYNPQIDLFNINPHQTQSQSYVNTRRMYQYNNPVNQNNNLPINSQPHFQSIYTKSHINSAFPKKQQFPNRPAYNYLGQSQSIDQLALRQKYKFNSKANNLPSNSIGNVNLSFSKTKIEQNSNRLKQGSKNVQVGKKVKNSFNQKSENVQPTNTKPRNYQSSQKFNQRKYPLNNKQSYNQPQAKRTQSISKGTSAPNTRYLEDNFNELNKTISNLKTFSGVTLPYSNYSNLNNLQNLNNKTIPYSQTISYNVPQTNNKNNQLFQMMKSILVGQQRLQKQLIHLKQQSRVNEITQHEHEKLKLSPQANYQFKKLQKSNRHSQIVPSQNRFLYNKEKTSLLQKQKSIQKTQRKTQRSPQHTHKSKSPRLSKSPTPKSTRKTKNSNIKRGRAQSAVNSKKAGKITKNKERFYELYKQAQTNKRLSPINNRIRVSSNTISSVWDKIKSCIERSSAEDAQTSVIHHENNRYVNDQLVNKIELQNKLKNDLVKKIYEMCDNKCLYK